MSPTETSEYPAKWHDALAGPGSNLSSACSSGANANVENPSTKGQPSKKADTRYIPPRNQWLLPNEIARKRLGYHLLRTVPDILHSANARYQEYRNVSKMIIVSVVIFVVCWSPFTIVGVLSMLGYSPSPELRAIPYFLSKSSVLYNPLIYVIFNAKFRAAIVNLFRCGCQKKKVDVMNPNYAEPRHVSLPQPMVSRSPVAVSLARNVSGEEINEQDYQSCDSLFGVPRYRERLDTVSAGLKIYSLEELRQ
ncbi:hypothetical protein OS493_024174 [Desmophyllum pertusum]|uniref:G-protein coupled receptors family 1 profile domain-containing protein n=1 Tax=Desmophyllum pertusum TaxID=174260 RepID=A0A9X0CWL3_9CNID|nr:hypothetical protein OS493_024174 [Desmophyllum pertusum]